MSAIETQLSKRLIALRQARLRFRECLVMPLQSARFMHSPLATAAAVWDLPMEAAAAGFAVTISQDETGWHVTIERSIDDDTRIHTAGDASSLLKALFQVVEATERQIAKMEAECRHQLDTDVTAA